MGSRTAISPCNLLPMAFLLLRWLRVPRSTGHVYDAVLVKHKNVASAWKSMQGDGLLARGDPNPFFLTKEQCHYEQRAIAV